ncbi:MAG: glycosyltransferase family 2 protein, partial [Actinomycetota bacterium]|nr:glycosyltransferase family 2 protein [Actinomycetota bacterium]
MAIVLVVRDAARWLRECVQALSAQTYPKVGIVAVDNASTDGSRELLQQALGDERVVALRENEGLPGAVRAAVGLSAVREADYLLLLHDDTVLSPEAVARMVEAAEGIERVGIVGPKVVDWEDPRVLREVGRSTDRFAFPYSPLEDGERDQGQYDRVREVLFVSSCAMLISRPAWERAGLPDERFAAHHDDLDLCWRARLAGFRVVMTPLATARHRASSMRGERADRRAAKRQRYFAERAALASMLKNYGVVSLAWLLPLYVVQGLGKVLLFTFERRFEDVFQILSA